MRSFEDWREAMTGRGTPFNLSATNENILNNPENQIRGRDKEGLQIKASDSVASH